MKLNLTDFDNDDLLQELIADNKDIFSFDVNGFGYTPLVCIGRGVPVGYGNTQDYIDSLYISPSGGIVLVETKLFSDQELKRTVVDQIIDYAKAIQKWGFRKLNNIAAEYSFSKYGQAFDIIDILVQKGFCSYSDESDIVDSFNESLSKATFLLMIVSDGISAGVQHLTEFLNKNTYLSFNLALKEMDIYQFNDDIIAIPNLIAKTMPIHRGS